MTTTRRKNKDDDHGGGGDDDDNNNFLRVIFLDIDGVLLPFGNDDDDGKTCDDSSKGKDNYNNGKKLFPRRCIEPFRAILEHTNATATGGDSGGGDTKLVKLILSSTWRMRPTFVQDIIDCFVAYGLPIQEFYDTTSLTIHSLRQHEIADWIIRNTTDTDDDDKNKKHRRPRRQKMKKKICWIALDDEDLLEDEKYQKMFQNHFIMTDSKVGLTMDDATKAIKMWNEQIT